MSQPPSPTPPPPDSEPNWIEDPVAQPGRPDGDATNTLVNAWSQLREQKSEFERRSEVLDALRQRLTKYLDHKNRTVLDRQRALDIRQQQNERERQYLNDAKLHVRRNLKQDAAEFERLQRKQSELARRELELNDPNDSGGPAFSDVPLIDGFDGAVTVVDVHPMPTDGDTAHPATALAFDPRPQAPPAVPAPLLGNWRVAVAILCGVAAAAAVLVQTDFVYRSVTPLTTSEVRPDLALLRASRGDLAVALQDLAGPPLVQLDLETPALQIQMDSHAPYRERDGLRLTVQRYLEAVAHAHASRVAELQQRVDGATRDLAGQRQELEAIAIELADRGLAGDGVDPKSELQRVRADLHAARTAFDQVLADIALTRQSLDELERIDAEAPIDVPDASLRAAEDASPQLHQDREELRFHLRRLRDHLLEAFVEFPQKVEDLGRATQTLTAYLQTRRLDIEQTAARAALDAMQQRSERLAQLIADFDRAWSSAADRLQRLLVDPRKQQTLEIQQTTEKLVRDLLTDATAELKALQEEHQKYLRSLENRAEHFEMTAELKGHIQAILQQQYHFATLANRVLPSSNIQLDTIMHRVSGLARRVRDRQEEVAEQLRKEHRATVVAHQTQQADELRVLLGHLDQQRQARLDSILAAQDRLLQLSPDLEAHGVQSTMTQFALDRQTHLTRTIAQSERQLGEATTELERAERAGLDLAMEPTTIAEWPTNLVARLSQVGAAGVLIAALMFGLLTTLFRARPRTLAAGS